MLEIVNIGKRCSGRYNSGDYNSGDYNIGDCNSGNWNSGCYNSGSQNSGYWNIGNYNSGNGNSGNWNSGCHNSGNYNSGNCNNGYCNSGDWNSGDRNSGNWNKTSFSAGCFCTEEPKILLFNKPSDWTMRDWRHSDARYILDNIPHTGSILVYVDFKHMTEQEKVDYPEAKTTGGYLKMLNVSECRQNWWRSLSAREKSIIKAIPNFDKDIFKEITGIDVGE